jgi:hypothetical protein
MIEQLLEQLSSEIGLLTNPEKDEQGYFLLKISESTKISVKNTSPGFLLQSNIAPIPKVAREKALEYYMEANFLGQGTGNAVIGLDSEEKFLTLSHSIPYDVDYKIFKEIIEAFANYLNYWQEEALRLQQDATEGIT